MLVEFILTQKVVLGVSACNMGCPVRYNRKGWDRIKTLKREEGDFKWHPVCPEVMMGLGVPRDPIKLVGGNGFDVWEGKAKVISKKGEDVTEALKEASLSIVKLFKKVGATGFVFMEGSPTCGVYRTSLKNKRLGNPPGVLGALLLKEGFFLIPALDIESPLKWWDWRRRLHAFAWLNKQNISKKQDLYNTWYTLKFLCQEIDAKKAGELGKELGNLPNMYDASYVETFKRRVGDILREPSAPARIKEKLWKSYVYHKRKLGEEIEEINPPTTERSITKIAEELNLMERKAFEKGEFFSSAPILYRSSQRVSKMLEK